MKPTSLILALALVLNVHAADDKKTADPAIEAAMKQVNATGASLMPVAAGASAYRFTALNVAREFTDAGLAVLAPVADRIASLDIARSKVTDAGLAKIAAMKNLKELHLEGTTVGDAGLDHLKGLAGLEYLNLYNTKVTDAGIAKLAALGRLKALYVWQSGVTKAGVTALKAKLPGAHINNGWTAEDDAKPVTVAAAKPAAAAPVTAKPAAQAPAATPPAAPAAGAKLDAATAAKAVVYRDVIAPIMQAKCVSCHGEEKKKGKLQLHTFAAIMKGGGDGANTVIAKNIKDSLMLVRANLPDDDDEHMPPSDEVQLTKEEVALIKWWIETGASETATVAATKPAADVEAALASLLAKGLPKTAVSVKAAKARPAALTSAEKKQVDEVRAKMEALDASLMPLAQDTEQLRLGVINAADKFGDKHLALVNPVAKHIVWADLSRSQVTDAAADTLAQMTGLERLHLENTRISDAALGKLAGLQNLEYLNLYGTKVTDGGIAKLASAKGLKKLFVWQTGVTQNGAKALEGRIPGLKVNVGLTEAEIAKLTAPTKPAAPAAGSDVIKTAMKTYHKPENALCKKISGGTASDAELATILKVYQDICAATPPKGDKADWVAKCQALIGAVKKIQAKDAAGVAAYKTAVNCKACHTTHKGS